MTSFGKENQKVVNFLKRKNMTKNGVWYVIRWYYTTLWPKKYLKDIILEKSDYSFIYEIETEDFSGMWRSEMDDNNKFLGLCNEDYYFQNDAQFWSSVYFDDNVFYIPFTDTPSNSKFLYIDEKTGGWQATLEWYPSKEDIPIHGGKWTIEYVKIIDTEQDINKEFRNITSNPIWASVGAQWIFSAENHNDFNFQRIPNTLTYQFNYILYKSGKEDKRVTLSTEIKDIHFTSLDMTLEEGTKKMIIKATYQNT